MAGRTAAKASVSTLERGAIGVSNLIELTDEFGIGDDKAEEVSMGRQGLEDMGVSKAGSTSFAPGAGGFGTR